MEPASALTEITNSYSNAFLSAVIDGSSGAQIARSILEYVTRPPLKVGSHPSILFKLQELSSAESSHSAKSGMVIEKLIDSALLQSIFSRIASA